MKVYSTEGIIFRVLKYSETSIICDIFTREKGLRSYIVSGVRTTKAGHKAAIYRPLNIVNLVSYDMEHDKLARITEISLSVHYQNINIDVIISSIAIFMLEVCRNAIKEREANEELYLFLTEWLVFLDKKEQFNPSLHLLFIVEMSAYLGFGPMKNHSSSRPYFDMLEGMYCDYHAGSEYILDGTSSKTFHDLSLTNRSSIGQLAISKPDRAALTDNLIKYYQLHISGFRDLNSLDVLRNVL